MGVTVANAALQGAFYNGASGALIGGGAAAGFLALVVAASGLIHGDDSGVSAPAPLGPV